VITIASHSTLPATGAADLPVATAGMGLALFGGVMLLAAVARNRKAAR
jgi:hypothetical protein